MDTYDNYRQRFFIENSPVRGDVVKLTDAYDTIINQKPYPTALKKLLGQMTVAASLLIGTLKIEGRLSLQLQSNSGGKLSWAMAECDSNGLVRALSNFEGDWTGIVSADEAFLEMGDGVLFINISQHNDAANVQGINYQGIVEKTSGDLGQCLAHYQKQSAQIPTFIKLHADKVAAGILVQLLPQSEDDKDRDPDLWSRVHMLASTIKEDELANLSANEILYRLYHEENVVLQEPTSLEFGCTCSKDKSAALIIQLGKNDALTMAKNSDNQEIGIDCGFCGQVYRFDKSAIGRLFD